MLLFAVQELSGQQRKLIGNLPRASWGFLAIQADAEISARNRYSEDREGLATHLVSINKIGVRILRWCKRSSGGLRMRIDRCDMPRFLLPGACTFQTRYLCVCFM